MTDARDEKTVQEIAEKWIPTRESLPEDGAIVETKIDDENGLRCEQQLKRSGNLWFFTDGSMYVYYTPTHWRECR